jgi:hypothetical protein
LRWGETTGFLWIRCAAARASAASPSKRGQRASTAAARASTASEQAWRRGQHKRAQVSMAFTQHLQPGSHTPTRRVFGCLGAHGKPLARTSHGCTESRGPRMAAGGELAAQIPDGQRQRTPGGESPSQRSSPLALQFPCYLPCLLAPCIGLGCLKARSFCMSFVFYVK